MKDLALAVRGLWRAPVFTIVAIVSLALAIGAGSAIFAVIDGILLRPPQAIAQPDRLVSIYYNSVKDPKTFSPLSWPDFEDLRRDARSFSGMLAYMRLPMAVGVGNRTENISGELVSENYLRVLGTPLRLGRDFQTIERDAVALIGEKLWRERFAGDPDVVGRAIRIGGNSFTVIGVVPLEFQGIVLDWGERPQIWIPMQFYREAVPALAPVDLLHAGTMRSVLVTGRLADGLDMPQVTAEIETLVRRIDADHPERTRGPQQGSWTPRVIPLGQARFWPGARAQIVTMLLVLIAVAACVLVIACANVASLLLTRAAQREREISVRIALGARAGAVLRLLLAESFVISVAGCAAGLLVATALTRGLASFPKLFSIPLAIDLTVNWRVAAFSAGVATLVSVLVGAAPLRQWMRSDLAASLRVTGAAARGGWQRWNTRNVLTAAQIAICLALLVQAGLFLRTFQHAAESDPFLRAGNLLIGRVEVPATPRAGEVKANLARDLPGRLQEIPAVQSAVLASVLPMSGMRSGADLTVLDPANGAGSVEDNVEINAVTPGFFDLAGSTLLRGRTFAPADTRDSSAVALVNQRMADKYWNGDALGKRLRIRQGIVSVVGIVRDESRRSYRMEIAPRVYFPLTQRGAGPTFVIVKTHGNPMQVLPSLQAALSQLEPDAVLESPQTLTSYTSIALAQERLAAWCLGALAIIALLLSLCGVYGTVAYSVAQRKNEIGIRVALGADSLDVVKAIIRPAVKVSATGLVAGSLLCLASLRLSENMIFGVTGQDPSVWAIATALLLGTALFSAAVPAVLASRIDAARVMRAG